MDDDLAPFLVALPRLVRPFFMRGLNIASFLSYYFEVLGEPCLGTLREAIRAGAKQMGDYDSSDLRELLKATCTCGGVEDVAELLVHPPEWSVRRMAALALSDQAGAVEVVGRSLQAGWADPNSSVRTEAARGYWKWLNWGGCGNQYNLDELLVPLLEAAARDEACRAGFQPPYYSQRDPVMDSLRRLTRGGFGQHRCTPPGKAMAAYALRFFPLLFASFREVLELCATQDEYEQLRAAATESLRVLHEKTRP